MSTRSSNPDLIQGLEPTRCGNGGGSNRLKSRREPENSGTNEEHEIQENREGINYPPRQLPGEYKYTPTREPPRGGNGSGNREQDQRFGNQEVGKRTHHPVPFLPRPSERQYPGGWCGLCATIRRTSVSLPEAYLRGYHGVTEQIRGLPGSPIHRWSYQLPFINHFETIHTGPLVSLISHGGLSVGLSLMDSL
ncbi:hypothetical protein PPACK8108_LOCUS12692 [Phakopsora pachyrhizi]|uniref:Uncharacterized protein n=1 Tax=Phakopsora pachyrhizi TaxID=170000 RepID=A0AAV0B733_PHAPC|nr:hypothetical protein PPACK8108_LOCUS12692 [Phakopsora pachyrhizi]